MSSKDISETSEEKKDTKLVRCENCRQEIASDKMFLHEGFCKRNNTYCEHCERIFLKEDYEQHKKDIAKKSEPKDEESSNNNKKSESNDEEKPPIIHQIETTINPTTEFEYIHMPLVEEYTINNPIIISDGQIVSDKNKNEYLLPFLGISPTRTLNNFVNDTGFYKNQELLNMKKKNQYKNIQDFKNIDNKNHFYTIKKNNTYNNFNFLNNNNNQLNFLNDLNKINPELTKYNKINYDNENLKKKNNKIIINNNIITYNDNKNISKIHNYFSNDSTPEKAFYFKKINIHKNEHPQDKLTNHGKIEKTPENRTKRPNYNKSNKAGPTDSHSKKIKEPQNYNEYKTENFANTKIKVIKLNGHEQKKVNKIPVNFKNVISKKIPKNKTPKNQKSDKNILTEKQNLKSDNYLLTERLGNPNIEEFGIEDNKKKILKRPFLPPLRTFIFHREEISPKQKIFNTEVGNKSGKFGKFIKNEKKINNDNQLNLDNSGKKNEIEEFLIKTEERAYRERKVIKLNKDENSKSTKRFKTKFNLYYKDPPNDKYYNKSKLDYYIENVNINMNDMDKNNKINNSNNVEKLGNFIRV